MFWLSVWELVSSSRVSSLVYVTYWSLELQRLLCYTTCGHRFLAIWREEKENGRRRGACLVIDSSLGSRKELWARVPVSRLGAFQSGVSRAFQVSLFDKLPIAKQFQKLAHQSSFIYQKKVRFSPTVVSHIASIPVGNRDQKALCAGYVLDG